MPAQASTATSTRVRGPLAPARASKQQSLPLTALAAPAGKGRGPLEVWRWARLPALPAVAAPDRRPPQSLRRTPKVRNGWSSAPSSRGRPSIKRSCSASAGTGEWWDNRWDRGRAATEYVYFDAVGRWPSPRRPSHPHPRAARPEEQPVDGRGRRFRHSAKRARTRLCDDRHGVAPAHTATSDRFAAETASVRPEPSNVTTS